MTRFVIGMVLFHLIDKQLEFNLQNKDMKQSSSECEGTISSPCFMTWTWLTTWSHWIHTRGTVHNCIIPCKSFLYYLWENENRIIDTIQTKGQRGNRRDGRDRELTGEGGWLGKTTKRGRGPAKKCREAQPSGGVLTVCWVVWAGRTWDESQQIKQTLNDLFINHGANKVFLGLGTMCVCINIQFVLLHVI